MSPTSNQISWARVRDVALAKGTEIRKSIHNIDPNSLLGSYFAAWDEETMVESNDDGSQEMSYLHLTSSASGTKSGVSFADIQGRFRWWRMIGTFRGLYRPEGASENLWYFGGVSWEHLDDDEGGPQPGEDPAKRSKEGFGLAAILTLDDSGNPFLEMLYKSELSADGAIQGAVKEEVKMEVAEESENKTIPNASKYTRIVWKKQNEPGETQPLEVSDREALNLATYCGVKFHKDGVGSKTWQVVRDAAVENGTKISTTLSQIVSPEMLLGSYGDVWENYTNFETMDEPR